MCNDGLLPSSWTCRYFPSLSSPKPLTLRSVVTLPQSLPFDVETLAQTASYDPSLKEEYVAACRSCGINRQREAMFAAVATSDPEKPAENGHPEEAFVARCANGEAGNVRYPNAPSSLPFANLRERTFDMTKRGELTPANVWYVSRRKDPAAVGGSHQNRGSSGGISGKGIVAKVTPEGEGLRDIGKGRRTDAGGRGVRDSGKKACSDRRERTND